MDAFANRVLNAMGCIYDAAQYANLETIPVVEICFGRQRDRYEFEAWLRRGLDPYVVVAGTDNRPLHEYQLNGITMRLTVKETY